MLVIHGLRYLKREGLVNFCRRLLIFLILEWWSYFLVTIKFLGKKSLIVKDIQGSKMHLNIRDKGVSRELAYLLKPLLSLADLIFIISHGLASV